MSGYRPKTEFGVLAIIQKTANISKSNYTAILFHVIFRICTLRAFKRGERRWGSDKNFKI